MNQQLADIISKHEVQVAFNPSGNSLLVTFPSLTSVSKLFKGLDLNSNPNSAKHKARPVKKRSVLDPGVVIKRRDKPQVLTQFHLELIDMAIAKKSSVEIYRRVIEYIASVPSMEYSKFEFVKNNNSSNVSKSVVARMVELGVNIGDVEQFNCICCENDQSRNLADKLYEISYFLKSRESENPLKIDYGYYVRGLFVLGKVLDTLEPLPESLSNIEYQPKPSSKVHKLSDNPLGMIVSMFKNGGDLKQLLDKFDQHIKETTN